MTEKEIRFVTTKNEEIFSIPDGDKICVTYDDSSFAIYTCKYVNEWHFHFGDHTTHIIEFAEELERSGATVIPLRSNLPEYCYAYDHETSRVGKIEKGGSFVPIKEVSTSSEGYALAKKENDKLSITYPQRIAMIIGAKQGWRSKDADPRNITSIVDVFKAVEKDNIGQERGR